MVGAPSLLSILPDKKLKQTIKTLPYLPVYKTTPFQRFIFLPSGAIFFFILAGAGTIFFFLLAGAGANHRIGKKHCTPMVPFLYALVVVIVIVIIILSVLLPGIASQENDKDPACLERLPGKTPETKVLNGSSAAVCVDGWVSYRGTCYYFSDQTDTWNNSQNFCKSHNSSLAIISNKKEMNFFNLLKSNYWIGLSRTQDDSGWVWTDGTFYSEKIFVIQRIPTVPGESEHVFLNGDGFKSENGKYPKKWICSKSLGLSS